MDLKHPSIILYTTDRSYYNKFRIYTFEYVDGTSHRMLNTIKLRLIQIISLVL